MPPKRKAEILDTYGRVYKKNNEIKNIDPLPILDHKKNIAKLNSGKKNFTLDKIKPEFIKVKMETPSTKVEKTLKMNKVMNFKF